MTPQRIELACGFALQRCTGTVWRCANGTPFEGTLRNLIGALTRHPDVATHYNCCSSFDLIYEIITDIRSQHGYDFLWESFAPDGSAIIVCDELDDYCCESRMWFTGGALMPLREDRLGHWHHPMPAEEQHLCAVSLIHTIAQRWNTRMGMPGDRNFSNLTVLPPWSMRLTQDHWQFEDSLGVPLMCARALTPHGEAPSAGIQRFCELVLELANAP